MKRSSWIALALAMILALLSPSPAQDSPVNLAKFLREFMGEPSHETDEVPYAVGQDDFDGDGADELVVYLRGEDWCGSGGCTMLVVKRVGSFYTIVGRVPTMYLPIRILKSRSHGLLDLTVWVRGATPADPGYEEVVSFDGEKYNKSGAGVSRSQSRWVGKVMIGERPRYLSLFPHREK